MDLFKASRQWAERPADERFWNVRELHEVVTGYRRQARSTKVPYGNLQAAVNGAEVELLNTRTSNRALLTHWAFGQLCARAKAPASYLRELPAAIAADCLNHGLRLRDDASEAQLMFHLNGGVVARSITSDIYSRIWNADITPYLVGLLDRGWITPPARPAVKDNRTRPATAEDVLAYGNAGHPSLSVQLGDLIAPAGVYASDHDMFVFMINPNRNIADGSDGGLSRGFFLWNSEVGAASWGMSKFYFRHVCGNHIVWDASNVETVRIRHVGSASHRFSGEIMAYVERLDDESASDDEARIVAAQRMYLGKTKDEVLAKIFGMRILSKAAATETYDNAVSDVDGDVNTAWGYAQALTRYSQRTPYADERTALDRAASKVLALAA